MLSKVHCLRFTLDFSNEENRKGREKKIGNYKKMLFTSAVLWKIPVKQSIHLS